MPITERGIYLAQNRQNGVYLVQLTFQRQICPYLREGADFQTNDEAVTRVDILANVRLGGVFGNTMFAQA